MSNELIQAADDARRLLRGFQAFAEVAAALDHVGALEQRKTETETLLVDLRAQAVQANSELADVKMELEIAQAEAKRATADAKTVADGIVSSANAKAADLVKKAEERAQNIVDASSRLVENAKDAEQAVLANRDLIAAEVKELEKSADSAREFIANLKG